MTRFPNGRDETTGILHRGYPTEKTGETVTVPIGNTVMEKGSYRHKTFPATVLDGKTKPPVTGCHACSETASDFLFQCPVATSHDLSDRIAYLALVDYDVHDPFPFHKTVDQLKRNCLAGLFPDVSNINKTYDQTVTKIWQTRIEKRIV